MGCVELGCPTNTVAGVNYYLARIQEQGASSWNIVSPGNGGTDNFKLKGQLTPGATYNFETRTWCNTGDSNNPTDPYYKSDWGGMLHSLQYLVLYRRLTCTLLM